MKKQSQYLLSGDAAELPKFPKYQICTDFDLTIEQATLMCSLMNEDCMLKAVSDKLWRLMPESENHSWRFMGSYAKKNSKFEGKNMKILFPFTC
jgi:hypothetical protein